VTFDHRAFLEQAPLVPIEVEPASGQLLNVGGQAESLLGTPAEDWLTADFWTKRVVPDDQATVASVREGVARDGATRAVDYRMEHADGRVVWVCEVLTGSTDGGPLRGYLIDVTARKRQEVTLWRSEERHRALWRSAPDAMVLTDTGGRIVDMNDQAEALFGYTLADVVGSAFDYLFAEGVRDRLPELRSAFERDAQRRTLVDGLGLAIERSDGTEVPVELSMSLFIGPDDARQLVCSVRDLTARRRVEAQLRSSERQLREMANVLPAMVCVLDADHRYRFANDAYAHWHGLERHQIEGRLLREVIGDHLHRELSPSIEAALRAEASHFRGAMTAPTGRTVPVDVSVVPHHAGDGDVSGYLVVIFDATNEFAASEADRRHREELAHVIRVATLGELAASIAHELNQPLSVVVANAQAGGRLLEREPPDLDELADTLRDIAAAGLRAGDVIASMRDLLQHGHTGDEDVDLVLLVNEVLTLVGSEAIARGVAVSTAGICSEIPGVRGDSIQLKQVILNLLMNAMEAASRSPSGARTVEVKVSAGRGEVSVEVKDSGPGLPVGDPEELFAPFVSRRADGLGMGLTISRSIAEAHSGRLVGASRPSGGAVFRLDLPTG
jgi:PAS domain S-box-containing protein